MPRLLVFACGFVVGRSWWVIRSGIVPMIRDASRRFDAVYASTARSVIQAAEHVDDRKAERSFYTASKLIN